MMSKETDYEPCTFCTRSVINFGPERLPVQPLTGEVALIGPAVLKHEDHNVPAKNRFSLPNGVDLVLTESTVVYYDYDRTSKRWRVRDARALGPQVNPAGQFGLEL